MPRVPEKILSDEPILVTNPDDDASSGALRAFLDEILAGPEPELDSIGAAEAIRASRLDNAE